MSNIFDYIMWRGDLNFAQSPLNEVDNLVICRLAYFPMNGIVPQSFYESVTVSEAAELFFSDQAGGEMANVLQKEDIPLFKALADSARFGPLRLCGYINNIDYDIQKQFCCITVQLEKNSHFLAYRGTDNTLVGWKEDFNMSFLPTIPAQLDAVSYLEGAAGTLQGNLFLGGHSKGGNLAVYAAAFCSDAVKSRIVAVYSNDGPGFNSDILAEAQYQAIRSRVHTYVPQSSIVGMLLEHEEDYIVIRSTQYGIFQHDLYSWEVGSLSFTHLENVTAGSHFLDNTLKDWLLGLTADEREVFMNTLFNVFNATNAKTLQEMTEGWLKNTGIFINAYKQIDKSTKSLLSQTLSALFRAARKNLYLLKPQPNSII